MYNVDYELHNIFKLSRRLILWILQSSNAAMVLTVLLLKD